MMRGAVRQMRNATPTASAAGRRASASPTSPPSPTSQTLAPRRAASSRAAACGARGRLRRGAAAPRAAPASQDQQQRDSATAAGDLGAPPGTPVDCAQDIASRPRRNRASPHLRAAISETAPVTASNFVYPLFVYDDALEPGIALNPSIASMPGCNRLTVEGVVREAGEALDVGVHQFVCFPKTPDVLKTRLGEESANPNGLAQRCIRALKEAYGDAVYVYTDVALDPYSTDGHDGIVDDARGVVMNDETVAMLCAQAVSQAEAGCDCVAPSDMMDGRVGAIRGALDAAGFHHVGIMSYCAKYASAFYGPFRDALDSAPASANGVVRAVPRDKRTYQMDPANAREALRELRLDEAEGADVVMVKPGMPYLDVIRMLRENTALPVAAYHVSGEYAMLKAAANQGWIDEKAVVLEALTCFKRAGADIILTYYAKEAATWLRDMQTQREGRA